MACSVNTTKKKKSGTITQENENYNNPFFHTFKLGRFIGYIYYYVCYYLLIPSQPYATELQVFLICSSATFLAQERSDLTQAVHHFYGNKLLQVTYIPIHSVSAFWSRNGLQPGCSKNWEASCATIFHSSSGRLPLLYSL